MSWSCIICTETLQEQEIFSTLCGHIFHLHCISQWLIHSSTCPQCRAAVSLASIHKIFRNPQTLTNWQIEKQRKTNKELTNQIAGLKKEISTKIQQSQNLKKIVSNNEVNHNVNEAFINVSTCKVKNLKRSDAKYEENQKVLSDLKKRVEKAMKPFESCESELKSLVEGTSDLAAVLLSVKHDLSQMKCNKFEVECALATVRSKIKTEKEKTKLQKMELEKLKRELESNKENEAHVGPKLRSSKRIALQAQDKNAAGTA